MQNPLANEKKRLREKYLRIRASQSPEDRAERDGQIVERFLEIPELSDTNVIFIYISRSGEVGTRSLITYLLEMGKRVLVPSPDIRAMPHDGLFRVNPDYSPVRCHESRIDEIDVIVVPGVVWDPDGYRIGFGGGYFDRLLSMSRPNCVKIGLAYQCQVVEKVPRDPWDQAVNRLVTE